MPKNVEEQRKFCPSAAYSRCNTHWYVVELAYKQLFQPLPWLATSLGVMLTKNLQTLSQHNCQFNSGPLQFVLLVIEDHGIAYVLSDFKITVGRNSHTEVNS